MLRSSHKTNDLVRGTRKRIRYIIRELLLSGSGLAALRRIEQVSGNTISDRLTALEQTVSLIARRQISVSYKPIRVIFLIHMIEGWDVLADVYQAMAEATDFEPIVVSINRWLAWGSKNRFQNKDPYGEEAVNHEGLEKLGITHLRLSMSDNEALSILKALDPHIIFCQQPWEIEVPPAFAAHSLNFSKLCYIPYGFISARSFDNEKDNSNFPFQLEHTDQTLHRLAWRIFCETEMHKSMYIQGSARQGQNVVVTGYPKFDRLLERGQTPYWPIQRLNLDKKPFRLIWAPHHSISKNWLGFGTFPETHADMLNWAKSDQSMEFVFKPHPRLLTNVISKKILTQQELDNWLTEWDNLPNTATASLSDYGPLFAASDAMITDGISFLYEYPLFRKPLIFLDSGHHVGFNPAGQVALEIANSVWTVSEAKAICNRLMSGEGDPKADAQDSVISRLMPFPGQSGQKILEAIREGLSAENGES